MPTSSQLLTSSDFEGGLFPSVEFTLCGEQLAASGWTKANPALRARYDRHATLVLEYDHEDVHAAFAGGGDTTLSGSEFPNSPSLIPISVHSDTIVFMPARQPMLWQKDAKAARATAVLINGPSFEFSGGRASFSFDGLDVSLEEFGSVAAFRRDERLFKDDCIATAFATITSANGDHLEPEPILQKLDRLRRFMTFLRGGSCSFGNIVGLDQNGETVFAYLGFAKTDGFRVERNWCDQEVIKQGAELFVLYNASVSEPETGRVLSRAIDYYRAANVGRASSTEMALVASYAALETLVPYILSTKAGWSNSLLSAQTAFADKVRATAAFIGLTSNPLEHAPALATRAKADANGDPYDVLALFRNRITHHKRKFSYSGIEIFEAWQLSQWLCELFVFYLVGYRGAMSDRRRYSGWRGPSVPVPLP